ncbi:MAG: hypothetical protein AAFR64_11035 [Pseudomonadota bacterium]
MFIETPLVALIAVALQAAPEPAVEPETQAVETEAVETEAAQAGETAEASEGAEGPPVDEKAQKDRDDEIICRRESVIGSKFKKRICATRKEWETLAQRSRDTTQEFQNRGVGFEPVN